MSVLIVSRRLMERWEAWDILRWDSAKIVGIVVHESRPMAQLWRNEAQGVVESQLARFHELEGCD